MGRSARKAPLQSSASVASASRTAVSHLRGYAESARAGRTAFDVDAALGSVAMELGPPFDRAGYGLKVEPSLLKQALKADPDRLHFFVNSRAKYPGHRFRA
jgi:hypothetical protein